MNQVIEEIKTREELIIKRQYLIDHPFSPNKITYEGKPCIIYGNKVWYLEKTRVVEDHYHKDYFIPQGYGRKLQIIVSTSFPTKPFHMDNSDSYLSLGITTMIDPSSNFYLETDDLDLLRKNEKSIIYQRSNEEVLVVNSEEEMEKWGFVKGTVNTKHWFHKIEQPYIDKMLPYKKFDHIISKVDIKELEQYLRGEDPEKIKKQITKAINENIKFGVDSITYKAFEGIKLTFGIEIETCLGRLEEEQIENLNLKAVHDGSLRDKNGNTPGGEYVSGVLVGDAGLTQLSEICRAITSKCKVNNQCGLHVHIGSLNWNKEDIVYSYILGELLEDEIFTMLPKSRRANSYCRRLTQLTLHYLPELKKYSKTEYNILIDRIYDEIFKEVTNVKGKYHVPKSYQEALTPGTEQAFITSPELNRNTQHPAGAKCGYEKSAQRYSWLNYVTLMYNTKGGTNSQTLEVRNHGATMNFKKTKNWIKIFFAFCRYVETNKSKIRKAKVTLEDIVRKSYPKTGESLIKYIEERKKLFNSQDESVDYVEIEEPKKQSIKEVAITI